MDKYTIEDDSFEIHNIKEEVLRGIYSNDYEKPSLIQQKVFKEMKKGSNIIVESDTLTGKTSSYIIYTLQKIDFVKSKEVQCLVLSSTREIAQSICKRYNDFSKYTNAKIYAFIGGSSVKDDIQKLSEGCHIVVGTPGRVYEMINKKILSLSDLKFFIIDEIEQIINRGFTESLKNISSIINSNCQTAIFNSGVFSSEMTNKFNGIMKLNNLVKISIDKSNELLMKNIKQYKISLKDEWKMNVLLNLYKLMEISQIIIYCNDNPTCETINEKMSLNGFICSTLAEDKEKAILNFQKGYIRCLIVTGDIQSKDIDIYLNSIIINYDIPKTVDEYFFRVGRVETFGKTGTVINFLTESNNEIFTKITDSLPSSASIEELPIELSIIDK